MTKSLVWLGVLALLTAWLFADRTSFAGLLCPGRESLAGQRVVVCGASTGIGQELAYEYCRAGAEVAVVARRRAELEQVAEQCRQQGAARVHAIVADLSSEPAAAAVIAEAAERMRGGGFDVLVLNHIVGYWGHWQQMWQSTTANGTRYGVSSAALRDTTASVVDVNALSYVYLSTHAVPVLARSNGSIVVVSSLAGRVGLPKVAIYAASKHFLTGFFHSLRNDLASSADAAGVSVSVVYLGNIDTPNARQNTRGEVDHLPRAPASHAAKSIVSAGLCRQREHFFPYFELRLYTYLYPFAAPLLDRLARGLLAAA